VGPGVRRIQIMEVTFIQRRKREKKGGGAGCDRRWSKVETRGGTGELRYLYLKNPEGYRKEPEIDSTTPSREKGRGGKKASFLRGPSYHWACRERTRKEKTGVSWALEWGFIVPQVRRKSSDNLR